MDPVEILDQLGTRGFEEGFQTTPIREFVATLTGITPDMREPSANSFSGAAYLVILYDFNEGDLEVIETVEAYDSPIAQLEVPHSTKAKSKMGYLGASMDIIINAGLAPDAPLDQAKKQKDLIGKKLHMKLTGGHLVPRRGVDGKWEDKPIDCWVVLEVAGEGTVSAPTTAGTPAPATSGASASQQALTLLDGKTDVEWHKVVFSDPIVKGDPALVQSIIKKEFLQSMIDGGVVVKDGDGIYHKMG